MRIRLDVAYDGTDFHGWAVQPGLRTVEGELSLAMTTALRLPEVSLTCAGRTDSGVHARGQVVHLDLDAWDDGVLRRLNGILAADVRVLRAERVSEDFDARFSALWRRYAYRIADEPAAADPLTRSTVLTWGRQLDEVAMNQAAVALTGLHEFAAFCKQREGATTIRTLLDLVWSRQPSGLLEATVRADAFCHSMVRSLVGCLISVGEGRRTPDWAASVLARGERDPSVLTAPARGLTLEEVGYPVDAELAGRMEITRARRG